MLPWNKHSQERITIRRPGDDHNHDFRCTDDDSDGDDADSDNDGGCDVEYDSDDNDVDSAAIM